jgi:hypothetical protein
MNKQKVQYYSVPPHPQNTLKESVHTCARAQAHVGVGKSVWECRSYIPYLIQTSKIIL